MTSPLDSAGSAGGLSESVPSRPGSPSDAGSPATEGFPRGLALLLGVAAAVVAVAGMRAAAWLIGPVFLALIIVVTAHPVAVWLRRKGWPEWAATLVLLLVVYVGVVALAAVLLVSVGQLATVLPEYSAQFDVQLASLQETLAGFGIGQEQIQAATAGVSVSSVLGAAGGLVSGVSGVLSPTFLILALVAFFILDAATFGQRLDRIAADRPHVVGALQAFASGTRSYVVVSTVFGLIVAVLDTVALVILGVPLAVLWGVLAFITNYIPNIGFVLGLVPPALLALLTGGWQLLLAVVVIYSLLNVVIQSFIQPRFIGNSVGLSATVTFVALLFWAWVLGPLGAILAIPLTVLGKALLVDSDPRARWADALLRSDTTPTDLHAEPATADTSPEASSSAPAGRPGTARGNARIAPYGP